MSHTLFATATKFRTRFALGAASVCAAAIFPAVVQAQIPGTTTRITTNPFDQTGPSISGNLICYTDYRLGGIRGEVYCHDLTTHAEFQVTASNPLTSQSANDVSGNTVVYTETSGGVVTAKSCSLTSETYPPCTPIVLGSGDSFNPAIDGSLVAWADGFSGNVEVFARDFTGSPTPTKITNNGPTPGMNSLVPNISGRNIAYSTGFDSHDIRCQVFVTNFDSHITTQITNSLTGCNSSVDISGNYVVYQANRDTAQNIFVYDLSTLTETRISLPGLQQNPHISGDWVAFEDITSTGTSNISSIRLFQISTSHLYTVVQATTPIDSSFLNDIDGHNLVYTSAAAGNYDIYLFQFTVPGGPIPFSSFHVRAEAELTRNHSRDRFEAQASFELGTGAAAPDPAHDLLHFSASGGVTTLVFDVPLSSFHAGRSGRLSFEGLVNGYPTEIHLEPPLGHHKSFEFTLESRKLNLAHFDNPIAIVLQIGNNIGQASIKADIDHENRQGHRHR
jgi:beta propeller repeat protein